MGSTSSAEASTGAASSMSKPAFTPPPRIKVAVIGAGAFGTSMAVVAARNGHEVNIWCRNAEQRDAINSTRKNARAKGVSHLELPAGIQAVESLAAALADAAVIMHALPAQTTPAFIAEHRDKIPATAVFCSTAKGLYLERRCLLSKAMEDAFDRDQPLAVLSGPSFAAQIIEKHPTVVVVASKKIEHASKVQKNLSSLDFRIYTTTDMVGVELGGSLKNPLAIGAGMIEGKGLGINTMAFYLTRAKIELQQLCVAMGGEADTVNGLSGIGDLMLTAFGDLSRNRTCGMRLVKGETLEDITKETTVEGVPTAEVAIHFADMCNLDVPIFRCVAGVLNGSLAMEDVQASLMGRPLSNDTRLA